LRDQREARVRAVGTASMKESDINFWDLMASIFWFMLLFTWISMLITIFGDLFRDHELSGWAKAFWTLFLVVVPWLGALVYLIARGRSINERALAQARRNEEAYGRYFEGTARTGTTSTADELGKLADLRDRGTISAEEFQRAKAKLQGGEPGPAAPAQRREHAVPSAT
jgi:hypothetical protein